MYRICRSLSSVSTVTAQSIVSDDDCGVLLMPSTPRAVYQQLGSRRVCALSRRQFRIAPSQANFCSRFDSLAAPLRKSSELFAYRAKKSSAPGGVPCESQFDHP